MSKYVGQVMKNNQGKDFKIVEFLGKKIYRVQFVETGSIREVNIDNAKKGKCRDYFAKNALGSHTGNAKGFAEKEKKLWKNMIYRVQNHPSYKDCSVCDRWLCFEYFLEDIALMENYHEWLKGGYELDKDIKYKGNKVYSKQNCLFVPSEVNKLHKEPTVTGLVYEATHTDGTVLTFVNQRQFANEHGLCYKNLGRSIKKGGRTKGWSVKVV